MAPSSKSVRLLEGQTRSGQGRRELWEFRECWHIVHRDFQKKGEGKGDPAMRCWARNSFLSLWVG